MKKTLILLLTGIMAATGIARAGFIHKETSGIVHEKEGYFKVFGDEKNKIVLTDGNWDGKLDRVDVYKNGKKTNAILCSKNNSPKDLTEMKYSGKGCYISGTLEDTIEKWDYYLQNYWIGLI